MIFILLFYKYLSHLCKNSLKAFREHFGSTTVIPKALREHYRTIPGTFREHFGSTPGTFQRHSGNISGTFREHYRSFREHSKKAAGCLSCNRRLFRFILITLFFSSVSRHLSAPFECCPPVIHLGSDHGKQLCPDGVLFHFLIKTVFLHHLQAFDHVRDFLRGICS